MAKLSKAERKAHAEAERILTKDRLTDDEREFVIKNWHEAATHEVGAVGAFFTPWDLACDFAFDAGCYGRAIDMCAGIGGLSHILDYRSRQGHGSAEISELVCIEQNPAYVEIGKKIVPDARWVCADVFDIPKLDLGRFRMAFGNPPFGNVARSGNGPRYRGRRFEYHVIDLAATIADHGAFIVPQMSASFRYSGAQYFERHKEGESVEFEHLINCVMDAGIGIDTSYHIDQWRGVAPMCEVVCFDFKMPIVDEPAPLPAHVQADSADLFAFAA